MQIYIKNLLSLFIFLEISPLFDFLRNEGVNVDDIFIFYFLFFIYLNINFNIDFLKSFNIDLIWKYLILFVKTPNFLLNFIGNTLKKIYLFLIHVKYKYSILTVKIIYIKYFSSYFLFWRPLFKKSSYFGYYRSNRSKWIK